MSRNLRRDGQLPPPANESETHVLDDVIVEQQQQQQHDGAHDHQDRLSGLATLSVARGTLAREHHRFRSDPTGDHDVTNDPGPARHAQSLGQMQPNSMRMTLGQYLPSFRKTNATERSANVDAGGQDADGGVRGLMRRSNGPQAYSRVSEALLARRSPAAHTSTAEAEKDTRAGYRRYRVGDAVLVENHLYRWTNLVNRYGFPEGEGPTQEEQRGPYVYVLATVGKVHFEEDAEYYTVTRADTGVEQRANAECMVPLRTKQGEAAAFRAATETIIVDQRDQELGRELNAYEPDKQSSRGKCWSILETVLVVLLTPFLWIFDILFVFVWTPILWLARKCVQILRSEAGLCLNGLAPYAVLLRFTGVNLLVLCSIWYMFIDQARLAFFPASADYALSVISFIVWMILALELMFEIFIRPDGYRNLIVSEKAYSPSTARFINWFHILFETISLAVFVPEFICLLTDAYCDDRLAFSFYNAAFLSVLGADRSDVLSGRAMMALIRLRVFGLVRHWKKMWINNTFISMKWKSQREKSRQRRKRPDQINSSQVKDLEEKDGSLVNASNIGTALMVTNSHRALMLLWAITGFFPFLYSWNVHAGGNQVAPEMVSQLQATNLRLNNASDESECLFLTETVLRWLVGVTTGSKASLGSEEPGVFVLYLSVKPERCGFGDVVTRSICDVLNLTDLPETESELAMSLCEVWSATNSSMTDTELADIAGIRVGSINSITTTPELKNITLEDGSKVETAFSVVAKFNATLSVEPAAFLSFLLQLALLICVLGGLTVLRNDAGVLVLDPLRRMLKIVARYAMNPLAPATTRKGEDADSDDESADAGSSRASTDQLGNYETEQLINAITKIADLLRKCWGVAGAGIISTNLAAQEGALTEVFNPTVPGKSVYALFGFAAINGFDHALGSLGGDVMILINDVAAVLHGEVFRWGFGDSGQCNKNLGSAFLMVFRIGLVKEVIQKLEEATDVVFSNPAKKSGLRKRRLRSDAGMRQSQQRRHSDTRSRLHAARSAAADRRLKKTQRNASKTVMSLNLQSLPGISAFTDRAVIGMLKSYAGIYRDNKLLRWKDDFRLGAGVGAFSVDMIFGMDAGWAVEGAVGSSFKIDATYLSPHVNMASRMMSACKQYGVGILLSQEVRELMTDTAKSKLRHLDTVTVKGSTLQQRIYTYDARHRGVDFFLFKRSPEQADLDSERYSPAIWNMDQDLKAMRQHVTEDFEEEFDKGRTAYLEGDWPKARKHLEAADEIMIANVVDMGYVEDDVDEDAREYEDVAQQQRSEMEDGPSRCLLNFMASQGGHPPERWNGYRPLVNK